MVARYLRILKEVNMATAHSLVPHYFHLLSINNSQSSHNASLLGQGLFQAHSHGRLGGMDAREK